MVARAFAAALLADGAPDPQGAAARVARGAHPDLTWVTPTGALEMLVSDVDEAVVAAIARTPFESRRRVFVIEGAHTMSDQVANRLLKTLEEPPPSRTSSCSPIACDDVLPTIASRCKPCASIRLPTRSCRSGYSRSPCAPAPSASCAPRLTAAPRSAPGWPCSSRPRPPARRAGEEALARSEEELELLPTKERKRSQREAGEAQRRIERRERTRNARPRPGARRVVAARRVVRCRGGTRAGVRRGS